MKSGIRALLISLSLLGLAGCGGDGLTADAAETGRMNLSLTGATSSQAVRTEIEVEGVALQPAEGPLITVPFATPRRIDLSSTQGIDRAALLVDVPVPAGDFLFIRLLVDTERAALNSFVEFADGSRQPLFLADDAGLLIATPFRVPAGGEISLTIDIDLSGNELVAVGSDGIVMEPALRLIDDARAARLRGRVAPSLLTDPACDNDLVGGRGNEVLLFPGTVTLDDVSRADVVPFTSIPVTQDPFSGDFVFDDAFLPADSFTIAVTCQALRTQFDTNDLLELSAATQVQLVAGSTVTQDFGLVTVAPTTESERDSNVNFEGDDEPQTASGDVNL